MIRINAKNYKHYSNQKGYIAYSTAGNSIAILKVRDNGSAFMYLDMVSNGVFKANYPEDSIISAISAGREVFYFKDRKEFGYYILQCEGVQETSPYNITVKQVPATPYEVYETKGQVDRPKKSTKNLSILLLNHFK